LEYCLGNIEIRVGCGSILIFLVLIHIFQIYFHKILLSTGGQVIAPYIDLNPVKGIPYS
jgi:hypothetical protein